MRIELAERVTAAQAQRLLQIGRIAADLGLPAHLVGGPVRDALLCRASLDVDVAVEGQAAPLAEALTAHFVGRLTSHERFGTAVIEMPDWHIDLAATRRETYPQPGALPEVEPATLDEDLRRRDFTYNAMALRLDHDPGLLHDPLGGFADLRAGITRALHERSFIDDPTRLIRAARYAARFACRLEPETRRWLDEAVTCGALDTVTGQRVWGELSRLLAEPTAPEAVELLEAWGLLQGLSLHCGCEADLRLLRVAQEPLTGLTGANRALAALALLAGDDMPRLVGYFGLSAAEVEAAVGAADAVASPPPPIFASEPKNSRLYEALSGLPGAALLALWVRCPQARPALERFASLTPCPDIDGHDLQAEGFAPSPGFKVALESARRAKLDEEADRAAQLAAARAALEEWQSEHEL